MRDLNTFELDLENLETVGEILVKHRSCYDQDPSNRFDKYRDIIKSQLKIHLQNQIKEYEEELEHL